jgi:TetR/AcrR family tetracycline transcriptional repressor
MAGRAPLDLDAVDIVDAALELLAERGLDAVSMRNVGARIGVSPVPLYARVGNKDALLDAMVDRSLAGMAPAPRTGEPWNAYAIRWARAVRSRLTETAHLRALIGSRRPPFVEASRPLIDAMRADGFAPDAAVQACRLLLWAVVGFATVEGRRPDDPPRTPRRPGGDPTGITAREADKLFDLHMRYVLDGIERDR